ncbi:MAG TPA: Ger(x)C family spore germination protein [Negativicutes bacterium]|nr:Ger(x)C family spore germination protein [Negativicutes bacterium]
MKLKSKALLSTLLLLLAATLCGCWDAKELDDLAIPLVSAYDIIQEGEKTYPDDKYLVTVGIPVFYNDVGEKFHIVETSGKTMGEARGRRNSELGEQVIFGQLQLLVFGEDAGKRENLLELMDIIARNPAIKSSLYVAIIKGRAADLIRKPVHDYPNMAIYLKALMENSRKSNFYPYTTLFQLNRELISYESAAIIPHVATKAGDIMLAGSCLINKGKTAAELGREETETAVMLRGIECRGDITFDITENEKTIDQATFEGRNSRKVKLQIQDGRYVFNIRIKLDGVIIERREQKITQDGTDYMKLFKDTLEQYVKKRAESFVEKTQKEFKFDALCLAKYIKANTREKLTKEDIDKIIEDAEINVEVEVRIRNVGGKM